MAEAADELGLEALSASPIDELDDAAADPSLVISVYGADHPGIVRLHGVDPDGSGGLQIAFELVSGGSLKDRLREGLGNLGIASWTDPRGGYFVSFDTQPGLAKQVVALAAGAGVKLTPAGAAYPYGKDPEDRNIRLAPSYPSLDDVDRAIRVFVTCVKLATVRQRLGAG